MLQFFKKSSGGNFVDWCANSTNSYYQQLFKLRNVNWNNDLFTQALPTPTLFNDVKIPLINSNVSDGDGLRNLKYIDSWHNEISVIGNKGLDFHTGEQVDNDLRMATIRQLRENIALQHFLETMQQGGVSVIVTGKQIGRAHV